MMFFEEWYCKVIAAVCAGLALVISCFQIYRHLTNYTAPIYQILAVLQIILFEKGAYHDGRWKASDGYLWITLMYNLTYSVALYALLLFYLGTHDILAPFKPLLKFAMVKIVVFLTFWQSVLIAIMQGVGMIDGEAQDIKIASFFICVEMLLAAVGMCYAFPHNEYVGEDSNGIIHSLGNVRHVINIHDVFTDTVHQFAPSYQDYVLYSNDGVANASAPKIRTETFVLNTDSQPASSPSKDPYLKESAGFVDKFTEICLEADTQGSGEFSKQLELVSAGDRRKKLVSKGGIDSLQYALDKRSSSFDSTNSEKAFTVLNKK